MRAWTLGGLAACALTLSAQEAPQASPWARAPHGSVKGTLHFPSGPVLYPFVVYLERLDGELAFEVPPPLEVRQKGARFAPNFEVVVRHQKVVFLNDEEEAIDHNVYFLGAEREDLDIIAPSEGRDYAFKTSGEVIVRCSIHKLMDGKLFVAPNPAYVKVERGSEFRIDGVPVGRYRVRTYQKTRRLNVNEPEITVRAEGPVQDISLNFTR